MPSELSIFAARLREHIGFWAEDFAQVPALPDQTAWAEHADAEFNGLAILLFALQHKYNQPYRKICEARGITPNAVSHWTQIPTVPTAAFKELELTSLPPEQRTHEFHSSGTSEQRPSRHFHNAESLAVYEASLWPWLAENLRFTIYDLRLLSLTPSPAQAPRSSLVHMFDFARRKLGAAASAFVGRVGRDGSWTVDFDAAIAALCGSRRREEAVGVESGTPPPHVGGYEKPLLLLGTAFSFVHLLDEMSARQVRLQLPPGSRVLETGGYKGRARAIPKVELHALITEKLGVPASHIICEYGMSELSSQAYDVSLPLPARNEWGEGWGEGKLKQTTSSPRPSPPLAEERENRTPLLGQPSVTRQYQFPPWARARVVSPETGREVAEGETGLLQVFDLANVFSVMAIQTGDLAVRRGAGFDLIGRAQQAEPRGCSLMAT